MAKAMLEKAGGGVSGKGMQNGELDPTVAQGLAQEFGTPLFVYDEAGLRAQARAALAFPAPFGLTVRYAMKAAPTRALLRLFGEEGLDFDAGSGFEVERIMRAGFPAGRISLSTQELPENFAGLVEQGLEVNACSLDQLRRYGEVFPGTQVGLRFNPGLGSGGTNRTNVGGPGSSFGIWHEQTAEVQALLERYRLTPVRIHTHIGSGSDPEVWQRVAGLTLAMARRFPTVEVLNMGGGYKVARMPDEASTDLQVIGEAVAAELRGFAEETGRRLKLEIEPGTFLVAGQCVLLSRIQDVTDTGANGNRFWKLDSGMTEILRPSLYGAQHPVALCGAAAEAELRPTLVVGHCCESGDILTPAAGDPEALAPRDLPEGRIGDLVTIGASGAYCSSMCAANYNSFPLAAEVLLQGGGKGKLIRRRQRLEQIVENEV